MTAVFICVLVSIIFLGDPVATEDRKGHESCQHEGRNYEVRRTPHEDIEVREVFNRKLRKRCECTCRRKGNPDEPWECCKCPWTQEVCFPGDVILTLENGSEIAMKNLKAGTRVKTVSEEGQVMFTEVKTFLKRQPSKNAVYLNIATDTGASLSLSGRHLVFVSSNNNTANMQPRFAVSVKQGDYLFTMGDCGKSLCPSLVTYIEPVVKEGVYVPLTQEGTLIVNDVFASCYSSINHHIAHAFTAPFRWFPWLLSAWQQDGYSPLVDWMKQFGHMVLPNNLQFQNQEILGLSRVEL